MEKNYSSLMPGQPTHPDPASYGYGYPINPMPGICYPRRPPTLSEPFPIHVVNSSPTVYYNNPRPRNTYTWKANSPKSPLSNVSSNNNSPQLSTSSPTPLSNANNPGLTPQPNAKTLRPTRSSNTNVSSPTPLFNANIRGLSPQCNANIPSLGPQCNANIPSLSPQCNANIPSLGPQCNANITSLSPQCNANIRNLSPQCNANILRPIPSSNTNVSSPKPTAGFSTKTDGLTLTSQSSATILRPVPSFNTNVISPALTPPSITTVSSLMHRPPRISLSNSKALTKMEPLTVSIAKENDICVLGQQPMSPLQPFSPSVDSTECTCLRSPKVILCKSCGEISHGRLCMTCAVHPRQLFLMDLSCCAACKSNNLKEICDAKK